MLTIPVALTRLIVKFAPLFSKRVWEHVEVLVVGGFCQKSPQQGAVLQ
jgi:hypothetical protein